MRTPAMIWIPLIFGFPVFGCGSAPQPPVAGSPSDLPVSDSLSTKVPASAAPAAGQARGPAAPNFTLPTLDGKNASLSDYQGKVVLIDFWSTTCDPCLTAMPHLVEMYHKHKERGFVVLAVSLDGPDERSRVSQVVHQKKMTFPVLLDEETSVVARYNPKKEMPYSVLVDQSGSIVKTFAGYTSGSEKKIADEVAALLK